MKITLAEALGTCFGVKDAIDDALDPQFRGNLTILGQLVHNPQTIKKLQENSIKFVNSLEDEITTSHVMITAHGAPKSVVEKAKAKGYQVHDASCPLVTKVHKAVKMLAQEGYFPVVIGQEKHVEVRGIVTDLKEYAVVETEKDFSKIANKSKIGIVSQTTNQIKSVTALIEKMKALRNPDGSAKDIKFIDTICKPTKDRQKAVEKLSGEVDLMIVVGGYNSSNTKKLKQVCDNKGLKNFHIECADELKAEWFKGVQHVGITAGTSTPSYVIHEIYQRIQALEKLLYSE